MIKKPLLYLSILLTSYVFIFIPNVATATDYKLGVVLFWNNNISSDLDQIKSEIASNDVYRENGRDTLQLVVQTEILWNETNSRRGHYDFSKYIDYAEKLKARGIKWTPLFPIHHPPLWVKNAYNNDIITDKHGNKTDGNFIHISPSSKVWRNEARTWLQEGVKALSKYIGKDKNATISEFFVTNETMYRRGGFNYGDDTYTKPNDSVITSFDEATIAAWQNKYGSRYGYSIPRNLYQEHSSRKNAFMKFRSEELAYCLRDLRLAVKNQLSSIGKNNIPVTWKLTPYVFDAGSDTLEQFNGWNSYGLNYLFNNTGVDLIALDEYQGGNGSSDLINAINKTRIYEKSKKPIYLAEFNKTNGNAPSSQVRGFINDTKSYGVTNWTFFSWNGGKGESGKPLHEMPIQRNQIIGLKQAFNDIISPDGTGNDPSIGSISNNGAGNQKIDKFYNEYQGYFGSKVGSNYSCFNNHYTCQNFSKNNKKIAVENSVGYTYYYNGKKWIYYKKL